MTADEELALTIAEGPTNLNIMRKLSLNWADLFKSPFLEWHKGIQSSCRNSTTWDCVFVYKCAEYANYQEFEA